jgi:hypothetical protein
VGDEEKIVKQIKKDMWLITNPPMRGDPNVKAAEWHFFCSGITGKIGPTPATRLLLIAAGIRIVIHNN